MSYQTDKRCTLKLLHNGMTGGIHVRTHEDRGDGLAACAIGTQYPNPEEWNQFGHGTVDCLHCANVRNDSSTTKTTAQKIKRDPIIAESLDDRIARMKREKEKS